MKIEINESEYLPEIEFECKECNKVKKTYHIRDVVNDNGKSVCCNNNTSTYALKWIHRHLMPGNYDQLTSDEKESTLKNYTTMVTS